MHVWTQIFFKLTNTFSTKFSEIFQKYSKNKQSSGWVWSNGPFVMNAPIYLEIQIKHEKQASIICVGWKSDDYKTLVKSMGRI